VAFSSDIKKLSIGSRTSATRRNEPEIDTRETTPTAAAAAAAARLPRDVNGIEPAERH